MIQTVSILLAILHCTTSIYKGVPVPPGQFGFTVQVTRAQYHSLVWPVYTCGGAIVSSNVVVTAAHCIESLTLDVVPSGHRVVLKVVAGETRLDYIGANAQVRLAKQIIIHEKYNASNVHSLLYDVALLVLAYPLEFNPFVYPVRLPEQNQVFNGNGSVAGWGGTGSGLQSDVLLQTEMRILSSEQCAQHMIEYDEKHGTTEISSEDSESGLYFEVGKEPDSCICGVGYGTSGLCPGDSGSPIVCQVGNQTILCGIESWGVMDQCENSTKLLVTEPGPEVFMAVANVSDWIQATISEFRTNCVAETQFDCGDGNCVPLTSRCDRKVDCALGTDEINCEPCGVAQFLCAGKFKCIDTAYVCDGTNDCGNDASDELGCGNCTVGQFQCSTDGACVDTGFVCDGVKHCSDASDEFGCGHCTGFEFQCKNKKCVHKDKVCDGHNSCLDSSDELACPNCPHQLYGSNCTEVPVFDDSGEADNTTCERDLDFVSCVYRWCLFNEETRECFQSTSFVHFWKMSADDDAASVSIGGDLDDQGREHWLLLGFACIGVAAVTGVIVYFAVWVAQHVKKWWWSTQRKERKMKMMSGLGSDNGQHRNAENGGKLETV